MPVQEIVPFTATEVEGDALWVLGGLYTWKATAAQTNDAYSLCEVRGPAGFGPPQHIHDQEDEGFIVSAGSITLLIGEEKMTLGEGGFGFVPRGTVHTFRFDDEETRLLLLITPGGAGHEKMFAEMGAPAEERVVPAASPNVDPEKLGAIAARNGTRIVGPPLGVEDSLVG
jgi:quercetin dioxygenase-like cupin family protein